MFSLKLVCQQKGKKKKRSIWDLLIKTNLNPFYTFCLNLNINIVFMLHEYILRFVIYVNYDKKFMEKYVKK